MPTMRPILPSMPDLPLPDPEPDEPVADVSKMNVETAKAAIRDAPLALLDKFEEQERAGQSRVSVIQTISYWRRKKAVDAVST